MRGELRHAFRALLRSCAYTAIGLATLALGIGAAVFGGAGEIAAMPLSTSDW